VSSSGQTCSAVVVNTPATTSQATCNDYIQSYNTSCTLNLTPSIQQTQVPAIITGYLVKDCDQIAGCGYQATQTQPFDFSRCGTYRPGCNFLGTYMPNGSGTSWVQLIWGCMPNVPGCFYSCTGFLGTIVDGGPVYGCADGSPMAANVCTSWVANATVVDGCQPQESLEGATQ